MALKVSDLLTLPILRDGKVVAGAGGLARQVRAVSFTDNPIVFSEEEYALTAAGDLYIFGYAPYRAGGAPAAEPDAFLYQNPKQLLYCNDGGF